MLRRSLQPGKCGVAVSQSGRLEQENQKTAVFKFLRQLQSREQSDGSAVALDLCFFFRFVWFYARVPVDCRHITQCQKFVKLTEAK